jgi:hypothetical protein
LRRKAAADAQRLDQAKQDGEEGKEADADEENGDEHRRRPQSVLGDPGDRRV